MNEEIELYAREADAEEEFVMTDSIIDAAFINDPNILHLFFVKALDNGSSRTKQDDFKKAKNKEIEASTKKAFQRW